MIGRAAQGNPWLIRDIHQYLLEGKRSAPPTVTQVTDVMRHHMDDMHKFYGEFAGVRIARKHLGWYCQYLPEGKKLKSLFNSADKISEQKERLRQYVNRHNEIQMGLAA